MRDRRLTKNGLLASYTVQKNEEDNTFLDVEDLCSLSWVAGKERVLTSGRKRIKFARDLRQAIWRPDKGRACPCPDSTPPRTLRFSIPFFVSKINQNKDALGHVHTCILDAQIVHHRLWKLDNRGARVDVC